MACFIRDAKSCFFLAVSCALTFVKYNREYVFPFTCAETERKSLVTRLRAVKLVEKKTTLQHFTDRNKPAGDGNYLPNFFMINLASIRICSTSGYFHEFITNDAQK